MNFELIMNIAAGVVTGALLLILIAFIIFSYFKFGWGDTALKNYKIIIALIAFPLAIYFTLYAYVEIERDACEERKSARYQVLEKAHIEARQKWLLCFKKKRPELYNEAKKTIGTDYGNMPRYTSKNFGKDMFGNPLKARDYCGLFTGSGIDCKPKEAPPERLMLESECEKLRPKNVYHRNLRSGTCSYPRWWKNLNRYIP